MFSRDQEHSAAYLTAALDLLWRWVDVGVELSPHSSDRDDVKLPLQTHRDLPRNRAAPLLGECSEYCLFCFRSAALNLATGTCQIRSFGSPSPKNFRVREIPFRGTNQLCTFDTSQAHLEQPSPPLVDERNILSLYLPQIGVSQCKDPRCNYCFSHLRVDCRIRRD